MPIAILAACSGGGGGSTGPAKPVITAPVLTTVAVTLSATSVQVGWTDTARAEGFDQRGTPISIDAPVWTTSSNAIATVDSRGVLTGVAIGQTVVIATVGGKQGQAALPVVPVAVATVSVDPSAGSAAPGEMVQFAATTLDGVGDTLLARPVSWSSTATTVATVSPTGIVRAISAGTSIIIATSEGQAGGAVIVVTGDIPPGVVVAIATPVVDQVVGDTLPLHAVARSAYAITGIVASVGSLDVALEPGAKGSWVGQMLLSGTLFGTFQVVMTATDANNGIGTSSVEFIRRKTVLGGSSPAPGKKQLVPLIPPVRVP